MSTNELYDALHLPFSKCKPASYSLSTTKSRVGDGLQGMTVESETVSLVPKHPMWPHYANVPECHKKDSIVSASSKGKGRERDVRRSSSVTAVDDSPPERRASEVPSGYWSAKNYGSSDDERSDGSRSTTSTSSFSAFLDANCRPMGSQLANTTSQMSRFSAYGLTAPGSRRTSSATTTAPDGMGRAEWWLEKKPSLTNTSFVSPAGRRASMGFDYGTIGAMPVSHTKRRASSNMCKRCFNPRDAEAQVDRDVRAPCSLVFTRAGIALAFVLFPSAAVGLILWSYLHTESIKPRILAVIPLSLWAIFIAVICKLYKPEALPRCTCANLSGRRRMSPLLQQARKDLDELERWKWDRRRSSQISWVKVPV